MYIATIRNSPWAKFITSITPHIMLRPAATRAYSRPLSMPSIRTCRKLLMQ